MRKKMGHAMVSAIISSVKQNIYVMISQNILLISKYQSTVYTALYMINWETF